MTSSAATRSTQCGPANTVSPIATAGTSATPRAAASAPASESASRTPRVSIAFSSARGCSSQAAAAISTWSSTLRSRPAAKAAYLFAAFVLVSPLGLLLALLPDPVYGFYSARPTVWGLSHLTDQEIAGTTMAAEQAVVFFAAFTFWFLGFLKEEELAGRPARYPAQPLSSSSRTSATPASQSRDVSSSGRW